MSIKKYITIQALQIGNDLIPLFDKGISFEKTEMYGNVLIYEGSQYWNIVECLYNLKTKEISMGIELDLYPTKTEYQKGEVIYYEVDGENCWDEAKIIEVVYEKYELSIKKGKNIDSWMRNQLKVEIEDDLMYSIKIWEPYYILDSDVKIEWEHEMNHRKS
jgi:hypothetical protein